MSEVSPRLTPTNTQGVQPQQRPWWERVLRPQTTAPPAVVPPVTHSRQLSAMSHPPVTNSRTLPATAHPPVTHSRQLPATAHPPVTNSRQLAAKAPQLPFKVPPRPDQPRMSGFATPPAESWAQVVDALRGFGRPTPEEQTRFEERSGALVREFGDYPGMLNSRAAWATAADAEGVPHEAILAEIARDNPRVVREAQEEDIRLGTFPEPRDAVRPFDQRAGLLSNTFELSQEEYDALTDQQKAVIQFNTGMVEAARADDVAGNTDASENYLISLGITPQTEAELDEFLQLDRLVGEKILEKLADPDALRSAADTMRWARGDAPSAGDARHISNALSIGELTSPLVAQQLADLGTASTTASTSTVPGFGGTRDDQGIQRIYLNMIDSRYDLTPEDIAAGIAVQNAESGTSVTLDQVWNFLDAQLQAASFNRRGKDDGKLTVPEFDPITGKAFIPLDIAEIRRRYGL